jgi:hypothetical protein
MCSSGICGPPTCTPAGTSACDVCVAADCCSDQIACQASSACVVALGCILTCEKNGGTGEGCAGTCNLTGTTAGDALFMCGQSNCLTACSK